MKASELRIGNWVYNEYLRKPQETYPMMIAQLATIEKDGKEINMSGIPLTPEWLERFGFKIESRERNLCTFLECSINGDLNLRWYNGERYGREGDNFWALWQDDAPILPNDKDIKVSYVHQLQNLYFALTGEELTVKEPVEK